jgi:hypothetical protein
VAHWGLTERLRLDKTDGAGRADGVNRADGSAGVGDVLRNAIKVKYEAVTHLAVQTSLGSLRTKGLIRLVFEMNLCSVYLETASV